MHIHVPGARCSFEKSHKIVSIDVRPRNLYLYFSRFQEVQQSDKNIERNIFVVAANVQDRSVSMLLLIKRTLKVTKNKYNATCAATFFIFYLRNKSRKSQNLMEMVHIALQKKPIATAEKKSKILFWKNFFHQSQSVTAQPLPREAQITPSLTQSVWASIESRFEQKFTFHLNLYQFYQSSSSMIFK